MSRGKSSDSCVMRGLKKLREECATHGFLTREEQVVSDLLKGVPLDRCYYKWTQSLFDSCTGRTDSFPMQDLTDSNILKFFYSNALRCQSRDEVVAIMKARNAHYSVDAFQIGYESFVRAFAFAMQTRLIHYLQMEKPHCSLSFQELLSPCGKGIMLIYITFTPTELKEQVTLFLGMIPIKLHIEPIGERHEQLLTDFNKFVANSLLGEYFAQCLVSVNATPVCAEHELLIGDCLLAVMNKKYSSQENRVVWCCNPKVVFHRVMNALHFIFSRRSFHRSATSHRFSDMFQFSLHFVTRLQTFCSSYKQQIEQVMTKLNISLRFPHLFFTHEHVATALQRKRPNANMVCLSDVIEDLPIVYRVLQEIVNVDANWDSNVRMCSKALVLRKVIEQPKFLPFMTLLKKTVEVTSVFKPCMSKEFDGLTKRYKQQTILDYMARVMESLQKLRNQFPSGAFASYEIQTKPGQWMSLNRHDNVSLGFNPPCDRRIRYKLGDRSYVHFAKNRFNEDEEVNKIFKTLIECTKSSSCEYTKDYSLLSTFMAVDFLPLCEQNRNYYFDLIMDEIKHFSSHDATKELCKNWLMKDGLREMNTSGNGDLYEYYSEFLDLEKLDTLFFDDYDAMARGAYHVSQLPTLTDDYITDTTENSLASTAEASYVYTAEAFIGIAYNGVGLDRFNMSTAEINRYTHRMNGKSEDRFAGGTKVEFTNWLFGK